jgi:TP901 family phage tail tape measure protein
MPLSSREIYLLLRARDEASRVVRGFSNELLRSATAAQAAAARAQAAQLRQQAVAMRASGATAAQVQGLTVASRAWDQYARDLELAEKRTRAFATATQQVGQAVTTLGIGLAVAGGIGLKFFFDAAKFSQEYQRQVALSKTQVDSFTVTLKELSDIGKRVANDIATPFEEIQPALFNIFSSTNANLKESEILLEGFARASVAGQTAIQNAARGTISIMNAFNIPFTKVNDILDIQFQLVRKGVGTYEEFAKVLGNVVPSATRAGQNFQTVAAMLAFLTRNGLSAAMAATSAARALEAMSHPKTIQRLEKLGIRARDAKGNFLPLDQVLTSLRKKLMALPPPARVEALVDLLRGAGGTIQARRFLEQVLLRPGELEEFTGFLKDMNNATGAFSNAYNEMADTAAAKSQLLSNRWAVLKESVGQLVTPFLLNLVDAASKVLKMFNDLDPGTQKLIVNILSVGSVVALAFGLFLVFIGIIAGVATAFAIAGSAILVVGGVILGLGVIIGGVVAFFVLMARKSDEFRQKLSVLGDSFVALKDRVVQAVQPVIDSFERNFLPKIIEAFRVLGEIAETTFTFVAMIIRDELIPALAAAEEWWRKNEATIKPIISILGQIMKWLLIVAGIIVAVFIAGALLTLIGTVRMVIAVFGVFVEMIKLVISWVRGMIAFYTMLWGAVVDAANKMRGAWQSFMVFLSGIPGAIRGFFSNTGQWLVDAGRNIVQGLINGLKSMIGKVGEVASSIAGAITGRFPRSPAKTGPLAGKGDPFKTGARITSMLADGLLSQAGLVSSASSAIASQFRFESDPFRGNFGAGPSSSFAGAGFNGGARGDEPAQKNVYITQHISTTGDTPAITAAKLGWELQAVI